MYQQQRSQHGVPSFLQQHQQQQQPTAQNNERGPLPFPPQQQPQNGPPRPPSPSWTFDSYGTPLAFVGPDAAEAAERATRWGYAAVFVADAAGDLAPVEPELIPETDRPIRTGGVRG